MKRIVSGRVGRQIPKIHDPRKRLEPQEEGEEFQDGLQRQMQLPESATGTPENPAIPGSGMSTEGYRERRFIHPSTSGYTSGGSANESDQEEPAGDEYYPQVAFLGPDDQALSPVNRRDRTPKEEQAQQHLRWVRRLRPVRVP
jgi:hypothetical protein